MSATGQTGQTGHPVAPAFVMDITIGATNQPKFLNDATTVEEVAAVMGKAAAAYLAAHQCEAYALRLTAIPINVETTGGAS
jgi:hypothetical protein